MKSLRRLYEWVLSWANSRYGTAALFVHSLTESFAFPIPPDPLLMALTLGRPKRGMYYATVCTVASVIGGLLGYAIGKWAWELLGTRIIATLGYMDLFHTLQAQFTEYTFWAILVAGFTPLPFKVFTITAGTCSVPLAPFVLGAVVSRAGRFFLVAGLIQLFGPAIKEKIDRYFNVLSVAFMVLLIGGFVLLKYLLH